MRAVSVRAGERTAEEALRLAAKDSNWVPTREHVQSRSISASLLPHDPFATPLRALRANARAVLDAYLAARPSPPSVVHEGTPDDVNEGAEDEEDEEEVVRDLAVARWSPLQ